MQYSESIRVWGDFACFTNPENNPERISYPVLTPSAARGILESVFWKPEFTWVIREIWVLNPIKYTSIMRNEIKEKIIPRQVEGHWEKKGGFIASENRTQRYTTALRDVDYVVCARIAVKPNADASVGKFRAQFRRRVERGQCFARPYLGIREFPASFAPTTGREKPINYTVNVGQLPLDMWYSEDSTMPIWFDGRLEHGILYMPQIGVR